MKKLFVNFMLVAVAAMAFTACQNEIDGGVVKNEENTVTMNFVADAPESRTSVEIEGTTATFSWAEEGETFTFVQNTTEGLKKGTNVSFTNNAGLAEISATFTEDTSPIVAVYPANAWVSNENTNFNRAKISVPTDQTITDGTFDPNADLLVSKMVTPENANDIHMLQFARLVAVAKMTIKNLPVVGNETIEKVNFSIDGENALTGRLYIDLATAEVSEWGYYGQNFNNVNLTGNVAATTANDIYFTCMPTTIASGDTFTLEVKTDVAVYTRTVTIPEDSAIEFNSGRVTTFGVNMASAERITISGIALPWSESFDSEDLSKYDVKNGGSTTKFYNENLAKGDSAGEILIAKAGGSMTATIASDGQAKTLYLTFKSNKDFISVSSKTSGVTIDKNTAYNYNITLANGVYTFKVTLANSNNESNARVDDILLTAEAPTVKSIVAEGMKTSFTVGDDFEFDGTVKANYTDGSSIDVTEDVTIDYSSVNMGEAGTYSVKISYNEFFTTYDITVSAASAVSGITYTKITSTSELTDGTYIIVYEDGVDGYVFNGQDASNDYESATISGKTITAEEAFVGEVTIAAMSGDYSLKVAKGYMYGTSGSNKINFNSTTAQANTITFDNGSAHIVSNTSVFRFNKTAGNMRFRYFKSSTYSGQQAVALYKKN